MPQDRAAYHDMSPPRSPRRAQRRAGRDRPSASFAGRYSRSPSTLRAERGVTVAARQRSDRDRNADVPSVGTLPHRVQVTSTASSITALVSDIRQPEIRRHGRIATIYAPGVPTIKQPPLPFPAWQAQVGRAICAVSPYPDQKGIPVVSGKYTEPFVELNGENVDRRSRLMGTPLAQALFKTGPPSLQKRISEKGAN